MEAFLFPGETMARMTQAETTSVGAALRAVGAERLAANPRTRRVSSRELLARKLWQMALSGDLAACRLLLEYSEGRPGARAMMAAGDRGAPVEPTPAEAADADAELVAWRAYVIARPALPAETTTDGA